MDYYPEQIKYITKKVTLISAFIDLFLASIKIIIGYLSHSHALIADGVHSLSDLLSDGLILIVATHAHEKPDARHPYGHERFETLATLSLSIILLLTGILVIYDGLYSLLLPAQNLTQLPWLFLAVSTSIIGKELLYWYTRYYAKKINSNLLMANAWHHRTDALSSIIVLISIIGVLLGWHYLDGIAAIILGAMIIYIAKNLAMPCVHELLDSAIDEKTLNRLKQTLSHLDDVLNIHSMRTRRNGRHIIIDIHIQVLPKISVSEGHMVSLSVEKALKQQLDDYADILVHIDPEDDEYENLYEELPNRTQVIQILEHKLESAQCLSQVRHIQLHYLKGGVLVDFYLSLSCLDNIKVMEQKIQKIQKELSFCDGISLYFCYE